MFFPLIAETSTKSLVVDKSIFINRKHNLGEFLELTHWKQFNMSTVICYFKWNNWTWVWRYCWHFSLWERLRVSFIERSWNAELWIRSHYSFSKTFLDHIIDVEVNSCLKLTCHLKILHVFVLSKCSVLYILRCLKFLNNQINCFWTHYICFYLAWLSLAKTAYKLFF